MTWTARWALGACLVGMAGGCSPGSFNGSVGGNRLAVKDAAVVRIPDNSYGNVGGYTAEVILSDTAGVCDRLTNNVQAKDSTSFTLELGNVDANGHFTTNVSSGTYPVITWATFIYPGVRNQNLALTTFDRLDSSCNSTYSLGSNWGVNGSVDLSGINLASGGAAWGSFNVTFQTGDRGSGSFSAPFCNANMANYSNPACR